MPRLKFLLAACALSVLGSIAAPTLAQKPAAVAKTYKITAGDILSVSAMGIPEIGTREVIVAPDGRISVPLVGQLLVQGLTLPQLEDRLRKSVSKFYLRPNISVGLVRINPDRFVNVIGPAERSNKIPMKDGWRVLDALASAGGIPTDRLEFYTVSLLREETKIPLDMRKLIQDQDPAQNLVLTPGDTIFITAIDDSKRAVTVFGQVTKTGPVLLPSDGSVTTVISLSGGFTQLADRANAYIERDGNKIPLDLTKLDQGAVKEVLKIGDKLYIPENKKRYRVVGAVLDPGEKLYPDDRKITLSEVLSTAKLPVQGVDMKKIRVTRAGAGEVSVVQTINVEKMLKEGDTTNNIEILPGDIITVPDKKAGGGIQSLQSGLWIMSSLIGIVSFLRR